MCLRQTLYKVMPQIKGKPVKIRCGTATVSSEQRFDDVTGDKLPGRQICCSDLQARRPAWMLRRAADGYFGTTAIPEPLDGMISDQSYPLYRMISTIS